MAKRVCCAAAGHTWPARECGGWAVTLRVLCCSGPERRAARSPNAIFATAAGIIINLIGNFFWFLVANIEVGGAASVPRIVLCSPPPPSRPAHLTTRVRAGAGLPLARDQVKRARVTSVRVRNSAA